MKLGAQVFSCDLLYKTTVLKQQLPFVHLHRIFVT